MKKEVIKVEVCFSKREGCPIKKKLGEKLSQLTVLMLCINVSMAPSSIWIMISSPISKLYLSDIPLEIERPFISSSVNQFPTETTF